MTKTYLTRKTYEQLKTLKGRQLDSKLEWLCHIGCLNKITDGKYEANIYLTRKFKEIVFFKIENNNFIEGK